MAGRCRWWLPTLVLTAGLVGCGEADVAPTPNTIVMVGPRTLQAAQKGIDGDPGHTFARFTNGATVLSGPTTRCFGFVGTTREFGCTTTLKLRSGGRAHCRVTSLEQQWRGRAATTAAPTWTPQDGPRVVSRAVCP